jgi:hypothetical protein
MLPTVNERLRILIDFPLTANSELLTKRQTKLHNFAEKELRQLVINTLCICIVKLETKQIDYCKILRLSVCINLNDTHYNYEICLMKPQFLYF